MTNPKRMARTHANSQDLFTRSKRLDNGCIVWQMGCDTNGYGLFWVAGRHQTVHRLMAKLLFPNPDNLPCVLHSCDNPPCINPDHLRWGTVRENNAERQAKGHTVIPNNVGSRHGMSKLTEDLVLAIRRDLLSQTQRAVANTYKVSPATISAIHNNNRWGHTQLSDI